MTMDTNTITTAFDNLRTIANSFSAALSEMGRILEAAVHDLKDRDEQIRVQQERISSLEEDNKRLQERLAASEEQVWQSRREAREAIAARDGAVSDYQMTDKALAEAKAEGVKLREIILNVAASVDGVINPKAIEPTVRPIEGSGTASPVSGSGGEAKQEVYERPYHPSFDEPRF